MEYVKNLGELSMKSTGCKYKRIVVGIFSMVVLLLCACILLSACNSDNKKEYNVTYDFNGGYAEASYTGGPSEIVSNSITYHLPQAMKDGYKFCGWFDNANFNGESISFIPSNNTRNYSLFAKFLPIYHATYFVDGGFHTNITEYTSEDNITLKAAAKTGYAFLGWYDNPNFLGSSVQSICDINSDIELFAKFSLLHNIEYDLKGGINSVDNPRTFCEDEQVILSSPK